MMCQSTKRMQNWFRIIDWREYSVAHNGIARYIMCILQTSTKQCSWRQLTYKPIDLRQSWPVTLRYRALVQMMAWRRIFGKILIIVRGVLLHLLWDYFRDYAYPYGVNPWKASWNYMLNTLLPYLFVANANISRKTVILCWTLFWSVLQCHDLH